MAQVMIPQKQGGIAKYLPAVGTLAGAAVGGYFGGPAGAGLGAGVGGAAGSIAGGAAGGEGPQTPQLQASNNSEAAAMSRRQQELSQDRLAALQQAEQTLPTLPESVRQEYGPAIIQARLMEQRQRGMA